MAELDRDGVRLHYEAVGRGPVVLLTHGYSASAHMFANVVEALAVDHTVVTWDLRGHARSDSPAADDAYSTELCLADMDALLDAVGAEQAVLAGHSLGGYLSLSYWLVHLERVRALVLIGTGPGYRNDEARAGWNDMAMKYAGAIERKGAEALGGSPEVRAVEHRDFAGLARAGRGILVQRDGRVMDALPGITVPTLVLVGERDKQFLGGSRYMAERIPGAELHVLADAGHAPNLSQPAAFNATLRAFLERLEGASS